MQESGNGSAILPPCCHRALMLLVTTLSSDGYQVSPRVRGGVSEGFWTSTWICCSGLRGSRQVCRKREVDTRAMWKLDVSTSAVKVVTSSPITTKFLDSNAGNLVYTVAAPSTVNE